MKSSPRVNIPKSNSNFETCYLHYQNRPKTTFRIFAENYNERIGDMKERNRRKMTTLERQMVELMPVGMDNAIKVRDLAKALRCGERMVYRIIHDLVHDHKVVIVGVREKDGGYFIPANDKERYTGLRSFRQQMKDERKRLKILVKQPLLSKQLILENDDKVIKTDKEKMR